MKMTIPDKRRFLLLFLSIYALTKANGQGSHVPLDRDYYQLIERYGILEGQLNQHFNTGFKPYRRSDVAAFADALSESPQERNRVDRFNLRYLRDENWEFSKEETWNSSRPWKGLYRKPADFFHYRDEVFDVHINPVLYFLGGTGAGQDNFRFRNTRGIRLRGSIDRKIGFYTFLATTETVLPEWGRSYAMHQGAIPGEGFWKPYGESGYSYFSATGYLTFQITPHIAAQLGQDRNFVGEGYRSLILSDFSSPYMFFKLNTKIWKLNFTNLWGQMNADIIYNRGRPTDRRYPQKWFSHHRLSINLGRKLNVAVFESVMASQFDWNYLNPVIFYRWVEHQLGTPDKVMLGADFKWNFVPSMQVYGQFVLDEFVFKEFFEISGSKSSRNKHGLQLGYKYPGLFQISNLDLQLEYNQVRPYTFQEKFDYQSFSNYRTPLTHPRGANFQEILAILHYQPLPRLRVVATGAYQRFGTDPEATDNYGGDILKSRVSQSTPLFGNKIGQGLENKLMMGHIVASFMLKHNLFLDAGQTVRRHVVAGGQPETAFSTEVALRLNINRQEFNY
ncbi:MAG TPA: hypothetical protein VKZ51_13425 [Cyclobacteriaceae bacterium]|nr:hypothetical protein [Cyclobacteriaceae bacterium]